MFDKLTLKTKLIAILLMLLVLSGALLTGISYVYSSRMGDNLIAHTLEMKVNGDVNAANLYARAHFGIFGYKNGRLLDSDDEPIEGRHDMVDAIQRDLGVVGTIFVRDGNDFRRIATNIVQDNGNRAVGTHLGTGSAAYAPVRAGSLYIGEATILGNPYLAAYDPILDARGEVIGILFIGIPQSEINALAAANMGDLLRNIAFGFIGVLSVASVVTVIFASRLSRKFQIVVDHLSGSASDVGSASNQVASASQSLAEGASEQASSLEETSSSLEEMASQTRQNSENAEQAEKAMKETAKIVESGVASMDRMSAAIGEIKASSAETSKIIKTIDEIAFQTNLLALNAAVEAARAGEAGKGFAVVAEEVRNLAKRSAEAAQNTSELIERSQGNADNGVSVTDEVSRQLLSIKESSAKVNTLISEIAAATKEQGQGIEQVNIAVSEMDKVVQQNAADSEESASAAEEMSAQAAEMERMVAELEAMVGTARKTVDDNRQKNNYATDNRYNENQRRSVQRPSYQKKALPGKAYNRKAEQVIPLDDDDFKDF